jgi:hypothetical protein
MELQERNYRSRLVRRRSTKDRREYGDDATAGPNRPMTDRERFSITKNVPRQQIDVGYQIKKWFPIALVVAVVYWVLTTFVF